MTRQALVHMRRETYRALNWRRWRRRRGPRSWPACRGWEVEQAAGAGGVQACGDGRTGRGPSDRWGRAGRRGEAVIAAHTMPCRLGVDTKQLTSLAALRSSCGVHLFATSIVFTMFSFW